MFFLQATDVCICTMCWNFNEFPDFLLPAFKTKGRPSTPFIIFICTVSVNMCE